jgi:acetyl esterase/lipase
MALEPAVQQLVDAIAALPVVDWDTLSALEIRANMKNLFVPGDGPEVPVSDAAVAGPAGDIALRIYEPAGATVDGPALVWFHGGGFCIGDLDTTDNTCRWLASSSGMRIVSVDYRLAPEHPYPSPVDDCLAAYLAVVEGKLGGPPRWVAVGGDSAGGNLAAVVCLQARDHGVRPPDFQLLVYPVTDLVNVAESRISNGEGYLLTRRNMEWFESNYVGPDRAGEPYASPLLAPSLADLPPAYVVTAGYDPLRDEGTAYADRLREAGVPVHHARYDGQIHGFFGTPGVFGPSAREAAEAAGAALRSAAG